MTTRMSPNSRALWCAGAVVAAVLIPPATATADTAQQATVAPVRITAATRAFTDTQGQRWTPAGSRLDGARRTTARPIPTLYWTPALYRTAAVGSSRARIRVPAAGRYAVTLYLVNPDAARRTHVFDVFSVQATPRGGRSVVKRRRLTVPAAGKETLPIHSAIEVPVRGRDLELRFRSVRRAVVVSAIEVQHLGPLTTPPVRPVWSDDFDGPAGAPPDPGRWQMQTGEGWGGQRSELQTYTTSPDNISQSGDGRLLITARRIADRADGRYNFTSGRIDTHEYFDLTRTRLSVRMTTPAGRGLWPAFWSWFDQEAYPQRGEVDVAELVGREPKKLYGFVHGVVPGSPPWIYENGAELNHPVALSGTPHTYEVRTEPGLVEFWFDGRQYGSAARADLPPGAPWVIRPDLKFRLILNLAVGSWAGQPDSTTPQVSQMSVENVSVWR